MCWAPLIKNEDQQPATQMKFPGELSDWWEGGEHGACGKHIHVPGAETCPAVGLGGLEIFAVTDTHPSQQVRLIEFYVEHFYAGLN